MPDRPKLSLLIADEHALVRDGISSLCGRSGRFHVMAHAGDGETAWRIIRDQKPDLALLDLSLPRLYVLEVAAMIRDHQIATRAGILTARRDRKTLLEILRARAAGIFLKSDSGAAMLDGLERIASGEIYLSPGIDPQALFQSEGPKSTTDPIQLLSGREFQVFSLLVEGIRAKEIAARLNLSPKTVDTYRSGLMRKLDIHDVAGLVKYAIRHDLTR